MLNFVPGEASGTLLQVSYCACVHVLRHAVVPKATIVAEAATSQASPPPPVLVEGDGQKEERDNRDIPVSAAIVSPWGISKLLAVRGASWLAVTLGAGEPDEHSWGPREPDWQAQLQPMGRPALAAQIEFHSCRLRFFSFSPSCAFPLCLWDWTSECMDGVLASKTFA